MEKSTVTTKRIATLSDSLKKASSLESLHIARELLETAQAIPSGADSEKDTIV